jgi:hypothetical protein
MSNNMPPGVEIIKATRELQQRVGSGVIDAAVITRCQDTIDKTTSDFGPVARAFLQQLDTAVGLARDPNINDDMRISGMTKPVMELKANAKMFRYDLVTMLANIMLGFLEAIPKLDNDSVEIVAAHHRTLCAIIERKMTGDGGPNGRLLQQELQDACNRYFHKRGKSALSIAH